MGMVLISAPPSGLIVKVVCLSLPTEAPDALVFRAHHCQCKALQLFRLANAVCAPLRSRSRLLSVLFPSLVFLFETASGYWSFFWSCHRDPSDFYTPTSSLSCVFQSHLAQPTSQVERGVMSADWHQRQAGMWGKMLSFLAAVLTETGKDE